MALFSPILQLGDFTFDTFEQPTEVTFGKKQATAKHILIGGGRVIDMLGAGDPDITWSGYFTGFQAEDRARFLESLTKQGKPLILKTSQFIKNVVISSFTFGYHKIFPIQYTITLQVIQDNTLPVTFLVPGDLTAAIISAIIQAQDIALLVNNPSVTNALALALIAAQAASPFDGATNAQVQAALAAATNAQQVVQAAIAETEVGAFAA